MKILLLGEFSGLHSNLAQGLMEIGHKVTVASNGDRWKNYPRDINFYFPGKHRKIKLFLKILFNLHKLVGYDIVQLVNPNFLDALPFKNKILFLFVKNFNKSVFLGANGNDYFYVRYGLSGKYNKSVFNYKYLLGEDYISQYSTFPMKDPLKALNIKIANEVNGITACCAEYELAYKEDYGAKLKFIPLPIQTNIYEYCNKIQLESEKITFFLGHYKDRKALKGTDVIHEVLLELQQKYPREVNLQIVDSVPFEEYQKKFDNSHVLIDQLYSYGCGLNGVLGMSKGMIVVGGADPYMYKLMGENENFPLVYLPIDKTEMLQALEILIKEKYTLHERAHRSREFAVKHHDYIKVAHEYVEFWKSKM